MIQYDNVTKDILDLYQYYGYQNMIKSILFRKQAQLTLAQHSAMIIYGPCIIIGGEFSKTISQKLQTLIQAADTSRFIYLPDGEWCDYLIQLYPNDIIKKQINLYESDKINEMNNEVSNDTNTQHIVPITNELLESGLHNIDLIKNELYSYHDLEDFYNNGYGLGIVNDNTVYGYCLSEYSLDNQCGINIWVDEKYRGLGYAKTMTNLFLSYCIKMKWKVIWGCNSDNLPSNKVALASGLKLQTSYHYYEWNKNEG